MAYFDGHGKCDEYDVSLSEQEMKDIHLALSVFSRSLETYISRDRFHALKLKIERHLELFEDD